MLHAKMLGRKWDQVGMYHDGTRCVMNAMINAQGIRVSFLGVSYIKAVIFGIFLDE